MPPGTAQEVFSKTLSEICRALLKGVDRVAADKGAPAVSLVLYRHDHGAIQPVGDMFHDRGAGIQEHAMQQLLNGKNVAMVEKIANLLEEPQARQTTLILTSFDQPCPDCHARAELFAAGLRRTRPGISSVMNYGLPYHAIEADGRTSGVRDFVVYCRLAEPDSTLQVVRALKGGYNSPWSALRVVYDPDFVTTSVARRVWKGQGAPARQDKAWLPNGQEASWIKENYTGIPLTPETPVRCHKLWPSPG